MIKNVILDDEFLTTALIAMVKENSEFVANLIAKVLGEEKQRNK